jgi:hypothetical protein
MKALKTVAAIVVPAIILVAIGIFVIQRQRNQPVKLPPKPQERAITADEAVVPRKMYIDSIQSAKALDGKTVWVQAGYELEYFPYRDHRVDYAKEVGVLPSIAPLAIKDIVTQKKPDSVATHIPGGDKQVLAVFTLPNDDKTYAVPIGDIQGTDSTFYCDQIFYYDDPHKLYSFWPADIWKAIDDHTPKPGMNELQVAMAVGVIQQSQSSDIGNRTVYYDAGGKKWSVTFSNGKATSVQQS